MEDVGREAMSSQETAPESGDPESTINEEGKPRAADSQQGVPGADEAESGEPESTVNEDGEPRAADDLEGVPGAGEAESGEPESTVNEDGKPRAGDSQEGEPGAGEAEPGDSQAGRPDDGGAAEEAAGWKASDGALEEALRERDQFRALAQRAQADLQNFRRRAADEREETRRFGHSQVMLRVLAIADDFERAMGMIPEDAVAPGWREGLDLVRRGLDHLLMTEGVAPIDADGRPFDPAEHEAVFFEETDEVEPGRVTSVVRRGYTLSGRVLRAAQVTVSRAPEKHDGDGLQE